MLTKYTSWYRKFRNKNISTKLKLGLKNTMVDKTVTCASEAWILTKR
jgi:hypothetical protein